MNKLRIAIQMDPLNKLHHESDSSLILANEAQIRGHKIFIYEPKDLILKDQEIKDIVIKKEIDKLFNLNKILININKVYEDVVK